MEGRRHSVDVPISRTLVALRRVKSLRDPSTNCKNWDKISGSPISLDFVNVVRERGSSVHNDSGIKEARLFGEDDRSCGLGLVCRETWGSNSSMFQRFMQEDGSELGKLDMGIGCKNMKLSEKCCKVDAVKGVETFGSPASNCDGFEERMKGGFGGTKRKCWNRKKHGKWSIVYGGEDKINYTGKQCMSVEEISTQGMISASTDDLGAVEFHNKDREWDSLVCVDKKPLLLEDDKNMQLKYLDSSRNICQKFMPKSFDELIGQKGVTMSLLNAISHGQITSSYIFYGSRGTGKTCASRIFAAAINCLSKDIDKPCCLCRSCVSFFSGKNKDVREIDSVMINKPEKSVLLLKDTENTPIFSRFKVYIVDDCHLLKREIWEAILDKLEDLPRYVVFIMITSDLDKLPHIAITKSQKYHFQKVKDVDIGKKLQKICAEEGLDYDCEALNFIASKSNGSLRDAEMTLDHLSLLGRKITKPLVYEVIGVVSDDELLDLLYLALSSDTSNTVRKARELIGSRIDPLQLVSQLANIIMDIFAGKCPVGISEVRRKFFELRGSEAEMKELSHALKVLSETEKQLRMSKNQTTWLTAALLQLSSSNSSSGHLSSYNEQPVTYKCGKDESESRETLELIWKKVTGMCKPSSLKNFLQKQGKLVSVSFRQGIAVAELEFDNPKYVRKTEKSWKTIATAFQHLLGYNVELRLNVAMNALDKDESFLICPCRLHFCARFCDESVPNSSENSSLNLEKPPSGKCFDICCRKEEMVKTIRNSDGNALSISVTPSLNSLGDNGRKNSIEIDKSCTNTVMPLQLEAESRSRNIWKIQCWRTAMYPFRKIWRLRNGDRSECLSNGESGFSETHS